MLLEALRTRHIDEPAGFITIIATCSHLYGCLGERVRSTFLSEVSTGSTNVLQGNALYSANIQRPLGRQLFCSWSGWTRTVFGFLNWEGWLSPTTTVQARQDSADSCLCCLGSSGISVLRPPPSLSPGKRETTASTVRCTCVISNGKRGPGGEL